MPASDVPPQEAAPEKIEAIGRDFQQRLGIAESVRVSIVESNKYLASVERSPAPERAFHIALDRKFLSTLNDKQLRAVIAHELGHIWIFTHHPYLQTEALANEKALLLVSRGTLESVYEKIWDAEGHQGPLQEFLAQVE